MASLRARRWLSAGVLVACLLGFLALFATNDAGDLDGVLRTTYLVAALMVLGTLAFGLSVWLLRCPRCGSNVARGAVGGGGQKSVVTTLVALLRPLSCSECGYREQR
ncbi:MAG: hypothetical protein IPM35_00245 [Myxococcales bacterium]|nr:hypothetical protein [Myxococcales bacterium]